MGGLEDATNLVDPIVSVITSIGYDHTTFLGDTIEKIAHHKAGIIKSSKPVVVGEVADEAHAILKKSALEKNAPFHQLGDDLEVIWIENRPFYKDEVNVIPLRLRLLGVHQFLKSLLIIKTIQILNKYQ